MTSEVRMVPSLREPSLGNVLRKYAKVWRVALSDRFVYRLDFLVSTLLRFLPMLTTILLWEQIFAGSESSELAGYTRNQMISYLLLVHISRMFSSMPKLAGGIARDIREGTLKKYLLQPIDMITYLFTYRIAHKMAYIMMSGLPYALLFYLCRDYLPGWPPPHVLAFYVASLLLGFVVGFFFEASIGMIGFWFLEVTSFLYVIGTITFFLSGHMFPLDLLDPTWVTVFKYLPFQYLAYYPATIFLEKVSYEDMWTGLLIEAAWAVGLFILCRILYRIGQRRYSAYGG